MILASVREADKKRSPTSCMTTPYVKVRSLKYLAKTCPKIWALSLILGEEQSKKAVCSNPAPWSNQREKGNWNTKEGDFKV